MVLISYYQLDSAASLASQSIWLPGWLKQLIVIRILLFLTIGPGDFLVHHAIALGLHTTTLILSKRCFRCTWFKINAR